MTTRAQRHLAYSYLLFNGLALSESLARQVAKGWHGYDEPETSFELGGKRWATQVYSHVWFSGVRGAPSHARNLIVCDAMKDLFELEGVAGFYFEGGLWRLNVPARAALLKPYRDADGLIAGLLVYDHLKDTRPGLLSSRLLPRGAKAEAYRPERLSA